MVDSGHFRHPYFVGRGYNVAPVVLGPAAANPLDDESGHGTGESTNIFAVAPDVQLLPVKINFVNSVGAFNAAVGLHPDIITCSWGSSKEFPPLSAADQTLATAIAAAVASGIVVVFSAGNGHFGFPGQHPDVISAGGVFMNPDESLRASDYASGFLSNIYPNRRVPDLSGLVGMRPKAIYLMLPLQPGDEIDIGNAGGTYPGPAGGGPGGDETARDDGWAAFSGTSAAAPQLAGAAALIKQACPTLRPTAVRDILMRTARDVTTGNCNPATGGNPATAGPDLATGTGLVDAQKAALLAKLQCLPIAPGPIIPVSPPIQPPIQPIVGPPTPVVGPPIHPPIEPPIKPIVGPSPIVGPPIEPIKPPIKPIQPIVGPVQPIKPPIEPVKPIEPIKPIAPIVNPGPIAKPQSMEGEAGVAGGGETQLTSEMVDALTDMIINTELE
jgi:subtilase family protein